LNSEGRRFYHSGRHAGYLPRFVDRVVPILQARGLFRREYPGTTLRESLGLTQPVNQFQQQ
jgi:hypothetical protein